MSIYDKASLVLIPSGTKTSKVYSQKPTNGDGDFTFSRSTAATRVNASGNIEKETQNLITYSNDFSQTAWLKYLLSLTSGQSGYDGTSDAWLIEKSGAYGNVYRNISNSGVYAWSVYAKAGSYDFLALRFRNTSNNYRTAFFDLSTGTLGSVDSNIIKHTIEDVGGGWYRCQIAFNDSAINQVMIYPSDVNNGIGNSGTGSIYIQDAQLEQGLVARDYIETTTTAIYGGITDNVPRLDYTDSSCPALLLEPQRTNKIGNSEFINNDSSWYEANGADCTPNYALSPEGVNNATRVQLDNSGAFSLTRIYHDFVPDASNDTASFYAKSNTGSSFDIVIYFRDSGFGAVRGSKTITITNEWQRFDLTADCSGAAGNVMFLIYNTTASENWDFLMYGAQVEAGSYATSYIPTYGSAVTRNSESCEITSGLNFIGQEQGTMYWDINFIDNGGYPAIFLYDGTSNNRLLIQRRGNNNVMQTQVRSLGSLQADYLTSSAINNGNHKMAVAYSTNDFQSYLDGASAGSDSSGTTYTNQLTQVSLKPNEASIRINQVLVFKTRLSNEELATLTTI